MNIAKNPQDARSRNSKHQAHLKHRASNSERHTHRTIRALDAPARARTKASAHSKLALEEYILHNGLSIGAFI